MGARPGSFGNSFFGSALFFLRSVILNENFACCITECVGMFHTSLLNKLWI